MNAGNVGVNGEHKGEIFERTRARILVVTIVELDIGTAVFNVGDPLATEVKRKEILVMNGTHLVADDGDVVEERVGISISHPLDARYKLTHVEPKRAS